MTRVLHVMNGASGGAAESTLGLIEALARRGYESVVACHDAGAHRDRDRIRAAVDGRVLFTDLYWWNAKVRAATWKRPLIEARQWLRTRAVVGGTWEVARFARRFGVDIVHTNTILTPQGGLVARLLRVPHVWHVRELVGRNNPFRLPVEGRGMRAILASLADRLVANSRATADAIRAVVADSVPLEIVPNGIALDGFHRPAQATAGGPLRIGMVASLASRVKKHALFLEAIARLPASTAARFFIVGDDPGDDYSSAVHRTAERLGLGGRVTFTGAMPGAEAAMAALDVLVHPCDRESFGRVVVEAMAAGLPVVGARGGGVAEIVDDGVTGLLAAPDDAGDFARAMASMINDGPLRERMGHAGRARAEACFGIEACADRIAAVYRGLA